MHARHPTVVGLAVGLAAGIGAAVLFAPKRGRGATSGAVRTIETLVGAARGLANGAYSAWCATSPAETARGLLPDERLTMRVQSALEGQGMWGPWLNVTTIDGVVYVRGRASEPGRAETILGAVRDVPGVVEVIDELRRE